MPLQFAGQRSAHCEPQQPGEGGSFRGATSSNMSGLRGRGARPIVPRASVRSGGRRWSGCTVHGALDPWAGREMAESHGVELSHRGAFLEQRAAQGLGSWGGGSTVRVRGDVSLQGGDREAAGLEWHVQTQGAWWDVPEGCLRAGRAGGRPCPALALRTHSLLPLLLPLPLLGGGSKQVVHVE